MRSVELSLINSSNDSEFSAADRAPTAVWGLVAALTCLNCGGGWVAADVSNNICAVNRDDFKS